MDPRLTQFPTSWLPPLVPDLRNAALLSVGLLALLVAVELWRRLGAPAPEMTRKAVHLGAGLALSFAPRWFTSLVKVALLGVGYFALLMVSKRMGWLGSVHNVQRRSNGAFVYPLSLMVLLVCSAGDALLFQIAVQVLACADAMAAVVGVAYGRIHFRIYDQNRSLEGSSVFLVVTYLVVLIPLLLSETTGRLEAVLIALITAAIVTAFEAISVAGYDNVMVPFATLFAISHLRPLPVAALTWLLAVMGGFMALGVVSYRRQRMSVACLLASLLLGYGAFALGGWPWLAPLLLFYLTFHLNVPLHTVRSRASMVATAPMGEDFHDIRRLFYFFVLAAALLLAHDLWRSPQLYLGFVVVVSVVLSVCWGLYGDLRGRLGTPAAELGTRILITPRWLAWAGAGMTINTGLSASMPGSPLAGDLRGCVCALIASTIGLLAVLALNRWLQARFCCPRCGSTTDNMWCHDTRGTPLQGRMRCDFDQTLFLGTAVALVVALALSCWWLP